MADPFAGTRAGPMARHIAAIRTRYPAAEPEWVAEVVHAVMASLDRKPSPRQARLLHEVEELGRTIVNAKREIAILRPDDITISQIPAATDELDAIVSHTASATNAILESCEILDDLAAALPQQSAAGLHDATTRIYEACSFQDITGQRITKVVTTLKTIEAKVAQILAAFGGDIARSCTAELRASNELLSGPQRPATAMVQSEIDQLLAGLD
ncbi:MAG TPA: protein phosphatase CheZ [Acetobacteraceae bacterium]|nr:protein phosphatase CheZ [Acetobacteraceae bacterium]